MAKLTDYENPISGERGSITNVGHIGSMVLGGVVLLAVWGLAQSVWNSVRRVLPGPAQAAFSGSGVMPAATKPTVAAASAPASSGPSVNLLV